MPTIYKWLLPRYIKQETFDRPVFYEKSYPEIIGLRLGHIGSAIMENLMIGTRTYVIRNYFMRIYKIFGVILGMEWN